MTTSANTTPESSVSSSQRFEQYRQVSSTLDEDEEKLSSGIGSEDEQVQSLAPKQPDTSFQEENSMEVDDESSLQANASLPGVQQGEEEENDEDEDAETGAQKKEEGKIKTAFPQTRIKAIMKADRELPTVSADAVFAVTVATELFLEVLAQESLDYTKQENRKTVAYKDIATAVNDVQEFEFLTDVVPHTIPFKEAMERRAALLESQTAAAVAPAESNEVSTAE